MSYSIVTFGLLIIVALASSSSSSSLKDELNDGTNVYLRLYSKFAQLRRPTMIKSDLTKKFPEEIEHFQVLFTEKEYVNIEEETLTILYTNVTSRTIAYHQSPNFEEVGTQYIYHRDPKDIKGMKIELVNAEDRLFREVKESNNYFYLTSYENLEYISNAPIMPYYEVIFTCNNTSPKDPNLPLPLISYVDRSFYWTPRYVVEIRPFDPLFESILLAYADIRNNGDQSIIVGGLEFIAGEVKLDDLYYYPYYQTTSYNSYKPYKENDTNNTHSVNIGSNNTYIYETSLKAPFTLPPHSTKSIQFLNSNHMVDCFHYYSGEFQPVNASAKLSYVCNITAFQSFIPSGHISLYFEGRFLGRTKLSDLGVDSTQTVIFGSDAGVSYHRTVSIADNDKDNKTITYHVQYTFKNTASATSTVVNFVESLNALKQFEVKNISVNELNHAPHVALDGKVLSGLVNVPHSDEPCIVSYDVVVHNSE